MLHAFFLTVLAGGATLIGGASVFFLRHRGRRVLCASLGFAAGAMLSVCFTELLPSALFELRSLFPLWQAAALAALSLLSGMALGALIGRLPRDEAGGLEKLGFVSMVAMTLHNLPEGVATFLAGCHDPRLGLTVAVAIGLHNIPEGIMVAMPVWCATGHRGRALLYTLLPALSEPIGAVLAYLVFGGMLSGLSVGLMLGMVAGIMTQLALCGILPELRSQGRPALGAVFFFAGAALLFTAEKLF